MVDLAPYVTLTKTITLLCGGLVTVLATRAYRRTRSPALGSLAVGFGLVTLGGLVAGGLYQLLNISISASVAIHSTFTAAGFGVLAYAAYARQPTDTPESSGRPQDHP
ncbi:MAG: hypothetical protein ABEJ57_06880 [Halobacteriaceae archaeon]